MKKTLLIIAMAFITLQSTAQIYASLSGGAQTGSSQFLMGQELNADGTKVSNNYGSFGEGMNTQLRLGYEFNQTLGLELGLGYLIGADQNRSSFKSGTYGYERTDAKAYARAYGLTLALTYNFSENIYGKFGGVTKVGGYTMAEFTKTTPTPFGNIVSVGKQEFHGKIPVGFIGALGYKYKISDKVSLFAELEYLGINVKRDYSDFKELTITTPAISAYNVPEITYTMDQLPATHPVLGTIGAGFESHTDYVDSLDNPNTDTTKQLSEVSPYSSFGLNIGITYKFGK